VVTATDARSRSKSRLPSQIHITANLDDVYLDQSHCLIGSEIQSDEDMKSSCFCQDAIADARYVYFTYLFSRERHAPDRNLNGTFLSLEELIGQREHCSEGYDADGAATGENWRWNGPKAPSN
jgi:hypothetical protein